MKQNNNNKVRYALGILLFLVAINAFGGGYYGLAGAKNVPVEWLKGSPFTNYYIPSLILFFVVGVSALVAAILVIKKHHCAQKAAYITAIIILIWLAVQVSIIGYVSWMQPATALAALLVLLLTWLLPKYDE